jgi:hypothetical protein
LPEAITRSNVTDRFYYQGSCQRQESLRALRAGNRFWTPQWKRRPSLHVVNGNAALRILLSFQTDYFDRALD